jgi:dihydrofolate reductase
VSLDFEGADRNVMAMPFDQNFSAYNVERKRAADTILYGRRTFEGFMGYWPEIQNTPPSTRPSAKSLEPRTSSRRSSFRTD